MNDVAAQTEKHTSDAAVLWPADAHQLITNDHVYAAANCENKLKKNVLLSVVSVIIFTYGSLGFKLERSDGRHDFAP